MNALLVLIGGALGSLLRYWLAELFYAYGPRNFPYGILMVNIIGCFFIGFFNDTVIPITLIQSKTRVILF